MYSASGDAESATVGAASYCDAEDESWATVV